MKLSVFLRMVFAGSLVLVAACSSDSPAANADAGSDAAVADGGTTLAIPATYTDELCHFGYYEPLGNLSQTSRYDALEFGRNDRGFLVYQQLGSGICRTAADQASCNAAHEALKKRLSSGEIREFLAGSDAAHFASGTTGAEYLEVLKPLTSLHAAALALRPTYKIVCPGYSGAKGEDRRSAGGPTATGFELIAYSGCDGGEIRANRLAVTPEGKVTVLESVPAPDCGEAW